MRAMSHSGRLSAAPPATGDIDQLDISPHNAHALEGIGVGQTEKLPPQTKYNAKNIRTRVEAVAVDMIGQLSL